LGHVLCYSLRMDIGDLKRIVIPILQKGGATRAALFGSYARGESKPESDVDILVELPKGKSLFDFIDLELELEDTLDKKVDLVEYSTIKPDLRPYILKDAVALI